jgi:putative tryptophan/tyrosine transport system substrate-binding protein
MRPFDVPGGQPLVLANPPRRCATRRRAFLRGVAAFCVVGAPSVGCTQPATTRRIGYLSPGAPYPLDDDILPPLAKRGWILGKNLRVEARFANGSDETLRAQARELVGLDVDAIVTVGTAATLAAKSATSTIPIVFWSAADPVGSGLVASLAKPGGNVTGFTINGGDVDAKRLEMLHDLLPSVRTVGVLEDGTNPYHAASREQLSHTARSLGMQAIFVGASRASELENAVAEVARRGGQALLVGPGSLFADNQASIMRAALRHSLATTVSRLYIRELGALISYAPAEAEHDERASGLVDRVLRGTKPSDLPVEQPNRFALIINLKTAEALGITISQQMLMRADTVIE